MRVKAEDGQASHLLVESQGMEVETCLGRKIALRLALANFKLISIGPAENKSKRFHQFLPNVQSIIPTKDRALPRAVEFLIGAAQGKDKEIDHCCGYHDGGHLFGAFDDFAVCVYHVKDRQHEFSEMGLGSTSPSAAFSTYWTASPIVFLAVSR